MISWVKTRSEKTTNRFKKCSSEYHYHHEYCICKFITSRNPSFLLLSSSQNETIIWYIKQKMCKSKKEFEDVWEEDERLMFFCELDFKCLDASIFASREIFRKVYAMLWVEPSMQLFTSNMISTLHILRSWTHYTLQRKIHNSKEPKASFILKIAFGYKCIDWFDWRKKWYNANKNDVLSCFDKRFNWIKKLYWK